MHHIVPLCLIIAFLPTISLSSTTPDLIFDIIQSYLGDHLVIITSLQDIDERVSSILFNDAFTTTFVHPKGNYLLELHKNVSYILIEDSFQDLDIGELNTKAKFLVIIQNESSVEVLKEYFKKLWDLDIYHVVAVTNMSVVTKWYPYNPESKCGNEVVLVESPEKYYEALPRNLNGCPVKMLWASLAFNIKDPPNGSDPGLAPLHLNTIAKKLNFTMVYIPADRSYLNMGMQNGNYDHIRNLMDNKTIDMAYTTLRETERTENMECSLPFLLTSSVVLLPPRKKIAKSINLLGAFSWETWLTALTLTIAMVFTWKFMSNTDIEWSMMVVIQAMLQAGIRRIPDQINFRILVISFLLYSMSFNAIYLSKESSELTRPSLEPKIKNMDQFLQTSIPVRFYSGAARTQLPTALLDILMKRNIDPTAKVKNAELIRDFVKNPNHGLIIWSSSTDAYFKNLQHLETFTHPSFFDMVVNAHARKNFVLLDTINWWIATLQECGLWAKWFAMSLEDVKKHTIPSFDTKERNAISLKRLYVPFTLWLVGLLISVLVFCYEIAHSLLRNYM